MDSVQNVATQIVDTMPTDTKIVAVAIMVKNEASVIVDTLKPLVETAGLENILVYDTGSTDDTVKVCQEYFASLGKSSALVKQGPWLEYADTRNVVLQEAAKAFDSPFVLKLDSEWYVTNPENLVPFCKKYLDAKEKAYNVQVDFKNQGLVTKNPRLFRRANIGEKDTSYTGEVQEVISYVTPVSEVAVQVKYSPTKSGTDASAARWYRDLGKILREWHTTKKPRWCFYLGQTYEDLGEYETAIKYYKERGNMQGTFEEEQYLALYRIGWIYQHSLKNKDKAVKYYMQAHAYRPSRAEPLVGLSQLYGNLPSEDKEKPIKYMFAKQACKIAFPEQDIMYVDKHKYDYERWEQLGIAAWYVQEYQEGLDAIKRVIEQHRGDAPEYLVRNYNFYAGKLGMEKKEAKELQEATIEKPVKSIRMGAMTQKFLSRVNWSDEDEENNLSKILCCIYLDEMEISNARVRVMTAQKKYLTKKGVDFYFVTYDEKLQQEWKIEGDVLYIQGQYKEIGQENKLIFQILQKLDKQFDYLAKFGISTVVNISELAKLNVDGMKHARLENNCIFEIHSKDATVQVLTSDGPIRMGRFGQDVCQVDNSNFVSGKLLYCNKSKDRSVDARNINMIIANLS